MQTAATKDSSLGSKLHLASLQITLARSFALGITVHLEFVHWEMNASYGSSSFNELLAISIEFHCQVTRLEVRCLRSSCAACLGSYSSWGWLVKLVPLCQNGPDFEGNMSCTPTHRSWRPDWHPQAKRNKKGQRHGVTKKRNPNSWDYTKQRAAMQGLQVEDSSITSSEHRVRRLCFLETWSPRPAGKVKASWAPIRRDECGWEPISKQKGESAEVTMVVSTFTWHHV